MTKPEYLDVTAQIILTFNSDADRLTFFQSQECFKTFQQAAQSP